MKAAKMPARDQLLITTPRPADGEDVVGQLLSQARRPTALLVESDDLAMRVLAAAWRIGLRTPQDLSVVGFDDHAMASVFGLTTMAQPVEQLGRQAAELALALASAAGPGRKTITVPTTLVLRDTTGRPPDNT
jgi:DNA-binding LacI/PurR family transcriptional regulator